MRQVLCRGTVVVAVLMSLPAISAATELQTYVQQCQNELHFNASDVPALNCNSGVLFAKEFKTFINDYLIYKRINDTVDLTAACRWLDVDPPNATNGASIELLIHNRQNGSTCFFSAQDTGPDTTHPVPVSIVSPTNFPSADAYWLSPTQLNTKQLPYDQGGGATDPLRCVGCHSDGPYIASVRIAPVLARFGLLNDRHDTYVNMTAANHYHAVASNAYNDPNSGTNAFKAWDSIIYGNTTNIANHCSSSCHALADKSAIHTLLAPTGVPFFLLPSIRSDIDQILSANPSPMPPWDSFSDYRWTNLDTPGDGVETENYADALAATNTLVPFLITGNFNCPQPSVPTSLSAHTVGVAEENSILTNISVMGGQIKNLNTGEYMRLFSLKDGLVCLNADQDPGITCHDYDVSYLCPNGTWTSYYNHTVNSSGGDDHEERSFVNAQITAACGGVAPVGIQARSFANVRGTPVPVTVIGPNDRLARFSQYGMTCNNADQPDAQCSNYVVSYVSCTTPPASVTNSLTSVWSGMLLAATSNTNNTAVKGVPSNSGSNLQRWVVEPVTNTEYVRLRNVGTSTYLNVTSQSEGATVVSSTSSTATSQRWVVEGVTNGFLQYRLRNLWSGRYLTINNTSTSAPVLSQAKNASWTSQRWTMQ